MKPDFGLFTEEACAGHGNIDCRDLGAVLLELVHHGLTEVCVGLKLDDVVNLAFGKRFGIGKRSRPIEPVVGDNEFHAGSIGVCLNAFLHEHAESDVTLKIGEADAVLAVVFRRRHFRRVGGHGLESLGRKHIAVELRGIEPVEIIGMGSRCGEASGCDQQSGVSFHIYSPPSPYPPRQRR
ncbi:hypothetical protein [Rhizobium laguerreae]|uniref:hypothetical protein n=1 Tax=Rhizobium laguerreae TaxID=1076926 RepID=UPI0021B10DDC|nr:hypothetical protein [Rhizobium laguerreae]